MKRYLFAAVLAAVALVAGVASAVDFNQTAWFKGLIYAGSSKVALTNATGNLSTTSGTYSGNVAIAGTLGVTGAATFTGATTHIGAVGISGALGVTGAATFQLPPLFASAETALTAHAGGTQAAALALTATKFMHVVSTVGTAADSVVLPAPVLGTCHLIANEAALNAMQMFAVSPATLNGVATATGISLTAKKGTLCCAASTTDYACTGPN